MKSELILKERPKAVASENIRTIRTNLQFTSSVDESKSLLVTSSVPGEGKSFTSSNLGVAFAQTGERTLIIDSDLRKGRLHKIFNIPNEKGLSNLLVGDNMKDLSSYINKTNIPHLYVITRGPVPPNPSELLNSDNTKRLVGILEEKFNHIIFDGPPINGLTDSLILANIVDRTAIVAACNYTSIDDLENTKKALENIDAKIAGVILNKVPKTKKDNYYYQ